MLPIKSQLYESRASNQNFISRYFRKPILLLGWKNIVTLTVTLRNMSKTHITRRLRNLLIMQLVNIKHIKMRTYINQNCVPPKHS